MHNKRSWGRKTPPGRRRERDGRDGDGSLTGRKRTRRRRRDGGESGMAGMVMARSRGASGPEGAVEDGHRNDGHKNDGHRNDLGESGLDGMVTAGSWAQLGRKTVMGMMARRLTVR